MPNNLPESTHSPVRAITAVENKPVFLDRWVNNNQTTFEMVMERLADELPQKYAELYIKCLQITSAAPKQPKDPSINNLNVQINTSKLDTLAEVNDTSWRQNAQYEEIK